jgi:hypothetical protein
MRIICEDNVISNADQSVLLRSAVLSDMHQVDPEGCVRMPCDTKTWRAWLTDDPSRMTADTMKLFVSVVKVRPVYSRDLDACTCFDLRDPLGTAKGERQRCYLRQT